MVHQSKGGIVIYLLLGLLLFAVVLSYYYIKCELRCDFEQPYTPVIKPEENKEKKDA